MPVLLEGPKAAHTYPARQVLCPFCGPGHVAVQNGGENEPAPTHAAPPGHVPGHDVHGWQVAIVFVHADAQ